MNRKISITAVFFLSIVITEASEEGLTARIVFPTENSLVKADVPIFGLAYGNGFKVYRVEYGEGINPKDWVLITEGNKPVSKGEYNFRFKPIAGAIQGNLGTWETGLTNYYYKDYEVDLDGIYTIRLVVEDTAGNTVEDRVIVEVGSVVTNVFGGIVKSRDERAIIEIPEHALYETGVVMSINPIDRNKIKLIVDPPYRLIGDIYEIKPSSWRFARDIKLKMGYKGRGDGLCIYEYDLLKCQWFPLETDIEKDWLAAGLRQLQSGRSYYAVLYGPDTKGMAEEFKEDWEEYSGVSVTADFMDGRQCFKFTNLEKPGYFAGTLKNGRFNASEYQIVEFGYRIPEDIRINLLVKVSGRWFDIEFTDTPKSYLRTNMKKIGEIPDVIADNQWRTARFNIYNMLVNQVREFEIEKVIFADFDSSGYLELSPGDNSKGAGFYIANFNFKKDELRDLIYYPQGNNWQLGIDDGSPDEFSYERFEGQFKDSDTDNDFYIGDPYGELERAVAFDDPETNIYFNLKKEDLGKTHLLYIDACHCDLRDKGYVEFGVWLNDKYIWKTVCIYEMGYQWGVVISNGLKIGQNKLTLKWLAGDNWIAWDNIRFSPVPNREHEI